MKLPFVSDQGSNLVAALGNHLRFKCLAHSLNLVLSTIFSKITDNSPIKVLRDLVRESRMLVKYLKKSGHVEKLTKQLISSSRTRFNSNYYLLLSVLDNYEQLCSLNILCDVSNSTGSTSEMANGDNTDDTESIHSNSGIDSDCSSDFDDEEEQEHTDTTHQAGHFVINKKLLEELIVVLKGVNTIISSAEADTKPTFQNIVLWINIDLEYILKQRTNDAASIKEFKRMFRECAREKIEMRKEHKFATALYPKFRELKFYNEDEREGVYLLLLVEMQKIDEPISTRLSQTETTTSSRWDQYASDNEQMTPERELQAYRENAMDIALDIEAWWKKYGFNYPRLAKIAKKYLAIPATNTTSERIFSAAGYTYQPRRSNLKPEVINKLMVLKSNLDYHLSN